MNHPLDPHIAVIGCGYWGKNLVRNFYQLDVLHTVCDVTEPGRKLAAETAPAAQITGSMQDVFANDAIRGVVIATPAETHYEIAHQALRANKHIFVEKPLALTYEQGARLVYLARKRNRVLMVGHVLEYHPAIVRLLQLVRAEELGTIRYIYSNRLSLGKIRPFENILWSFAPHDVAVILRLMGAMPFQVTACGGSYIQANIADVTVTHLLFDNGVRAHIHVSWLHPFKEQRLVVIGSQKMASFNDVNKELMLYDQRVDIERGEPVPVKGEGELVAFPDDEPLRRECQAFLEAMQSGHAPVTDGESGLRVLRVLQAAQRSLVMNGEPITLPIDAFSLENLQT